MVDVCGIGIVSALGIGVQQNLSALLDMRDGLSESPSHFQTIHRVPVGEVKSIDNDNYNLDAPVSRTALLATFAAQEALDDAQLPRRDMPFISATTVGGMDMTPRFYKDFLREHGHGRLRYVAQHDCSASTLFVRNQCGLTGYHSTISTACSSGANAIMTAAQLIELGFADYAIAGGTDALCAYTLDGFKSLLLLDSAKCKPFDANRSGLNLGEGAAYLVLKRPSAPGKRYCSLVGFANANDAFHQTATSPNGLGPRLAMQLALQSANLKPTEVGYINAHGTATTTNDASEMAAIQSLFGNNIPPYGSTKPFTGHTLAAAGAIEAVFSILAITNAVAWASLNCSTPMTANAPVSTNMALLKPVVLSNSFGFGGNCTSLIFAS